MSLDIPAMVFNNTGTPYVGSALLKHLFGSEGGYACEPRVYKTSRDIDEVVNLFYGYYPTHIYDGPNFKSRLIMWRDCRVLIYTNSKNSPTGMGLSFLVYGHDKTACQPALNLIDSFVDETHEDPSRIDMAFWSGSREPEEISRTLSMPDWEDIEQNYAWDKSSSLPKLISLKKPEDMGRILLFHGVPGTGKSYFIRSLIRAWNSWCEAHYILDPEKFFGDAYYMTQIILNNTDRWDPEEHVLVPTGKWKLVIVEDADEYIQEDAKERSSLGALSRLLNLTDGLIGQGLNIIVLITTNEPLEKIHPAIKRQGRSLANIEFDFFNTEDANEWLAAMGSDSKVIKPASLADLYATVGESSISTEKEKRKVGFV